MGALAFFARVPITSGRLRDKVIATLEEELDANVELGDLTLHLFPRLRATGTNLTVHKTQGDGRKPLISIASFKVEADLVGVWRRHITRVVVDGLTIEIPPGRRDDEPRPEKREAKEAEPKDAVRKDDNGKEFVVDELVADQAAVVILPRDPAKHPKTWDLHQLHMTNVGIGQKMPFRSTLTNAVPPGEIETSGSFGPWNVEEPGETPLDGVFTFDNADLSVFKGISGILSARGSYDGSLEQIDVNGQTSTPDFTVTVGGQPVPLETTYHAIVDGTNGNTTLERIDASFLNTSLVARGGVYDVEDVKGRRVTLDVEMTKARLEDVLRLAVKTSRPPMTGALRLKTAFELPPGDIDVVDKLGLNGTFAIHGGRFTDAGVQEKIAGLSHRASGRKAQTPPTDLRSEFSGDFRLRKGVLSLPRVAFDVPSAAVQLNGQYALRKETLSFAGNLYMDAKVSQTMTGFKSVLLKIVDPLFRRDGQTVIPIKISGTRDDPKFGMDVKRVFTRDSSARPLRAGTPDTPARPAPRTPVNDRAAAGASARE